MQKFSNKLLKTNYKQRLMVFGSFMLMAVVAYYFIGNILTERMINQAENRLNSLEANVQSGLAEAEVSILNAYYNIGTMLEQGVTNDDILAYLVQTTDWMRSREQGLTKLHGIYGHFNGEFIDGIDLNPGYDYIPSSRPWYQLAVRSVEKEKGKVTYTEPYVDTSTGETICTAVMNVFANDGGVIGILALDVTIDKLTNYVSSTNLTPNGYGMLLNQNMYIIAHRDEDKINKNLYELGQENKKIATILRNIDGITNMRLKGEDRSLQSAFFKKMYNGWYVGIITPNREFYKDLYVSIIFLGFLALIFGGILSRSICILNTERERSEEKNRSKSSFLATMSHEIRTPINAVLGIAEIELSRSDLPNDIADSFGKIRSSGRGLLGIINDILDLSKIETGKLELNPAKYELASLINDSVQLNIMRIEDKPIEFVLKVEELLPARLVGDELRLKQILNNILSNAFKYTNSGEVTLSISQECTENGIDITFKVADTGQGMKPEDMERLFTEYTRFNNQANRTTEGTGLGLSITHKLVTLMGGEIRVESKIGVGSTFTVTVPQGFVDSKIIGKETAERLGKFTFADKEQDQIIREYMPYGKVLIVDDVEINLYVARGLLTPYGLEIETAISGFEALERIESGMIYDIIFLDHMMPGMDGIETAEKIRELKYEGTIVALTANALAGNEKMFSENGFDDFLSKPIDIRKMNTVLNKYIRDKQDPETIEATRSITATSFLSTKLDDELIEVFKRDAKKAILTLSETVDNGDYKLFAITAHAMKSALLNIGEKDLSDVASEFEIAGKEKDMEYISKHIEEFLKNLKDIIGEEPIMEENVIEDREFLRKQLEIILEACEDYDDKICEMAVKSLEDLEWKNNTKAEIADIKELVLFNDFEAVEEKVTKLIESVCSIE